MPKKQIIRVKWKNFLFFIILNTCIVIVILSSIKIAKWYIDSKDTTTQINNILEVTEIKEIKDTEKTQIIENNELENDNPYIDYIKMNLIDVDFKDLKEQNASTIGWIKVSGTNINYPFVQAKDNDYYLNHSFNKTYNNAGWIFLDYRNSINKLDKNMIIYGHGRSDKTMFGTLKNTLYKEWLNNPLNHIIKISTEYGNTLWQIFSIYHIETTSDYLYTNFNSNKEFRKFSDMLLDRSIFDFKTSVSDDDNILTLSTCYNDKEKMVVHAKLIKIQQK